MRPGDRRKEGEGEEREGGERGERGEGREGEGRGEREGGREGERERGDRGIRIRWRVKRKESKYILYLESISNTITCKASQTLQAWA